MPLTLRYASFRCALVLMAAASHSALAQKPRVIGPIEADREVVLQKHLHPLARPEFDRGAADPAMKLDYVTMVLKPTAAQESDLETLLIQQQDRSSAGYHKWLTPEQFGDRFGLAASDIAAVSSWIEAQGLHIEDTARGRNWIAFSGTVAQIQQALHTEIHRFVVDGEMHYANATDPSVPAALADVVRFFRGLDDFEPEPPAGIRYGTPITPGYTSSTGSHSMAPDDFATIYDLTPLYQNGVYGDQQSVAVLGRTDIDLPGYQTFRSLYHLPATMPVMHLVGADPGLSSSDLGEAMLDLEWSGAVARNSTIIYVYATSIYTAAQEAVDKNLAPVISSSYSSCEPDSADSLRYLAQQANAQGITWLVVTNDSGAAACDKHSDRQLASTGLAVSYPASIPEITAVGGTMFNEGSGTYWNPTDTSTGASAVSYIPEVGWNENGPAGIFSSGGGVSIFYSKPFWQTGSPADNARDLPDISMAAASHDAYRTYYNGLNWVYSGTSAATPAFAGVVSLLNQYQLKNGLQSAPGMGNINPELYRLAQTYPAAFHDVTTGNNYVPCVQSSPDCLTGSFGYTAGPGYDLVTGIGSVDVNNLITHWNQNGVPTTTRVSAAPANIAFGTKPQLTATVSSSNGTIIPTGTVSFLVPGGAPGTPDLGSAVLGVSGGVAMASIAADPNQLSMGANTIIAVYSGDGHYDVSSATTTVTVTPPANAAAIAAAITPDPVYASASTGGVTSWYYTITLTEQAGVAATLTRFAIAGADESSRLSTFFTNGTLIPAHGTLIGGVTSTGLSPPVSLTFTFGGTDVNGNSWNQQITVQFIGPILQPEIVLSGVPATVQQNPSADPSCQWTERLNVQELGGYNMQLFKFLAGSNDLTSQISRYFGTTEIAPFGALQATVCSSGSAPPAPVSYELDGETDGGTTFRTVFTTSYAAALASPASLSITQSAVALSTPSNSGSVTAPLNVNLSGGSSSWTTTIFPSNPTTSWLKIAPASGSGSGTITLTATATGQAPGVYRATVIVQGANSVPQFIEAPVSFTVGASPDISIGGVANGASFQHNYAPGMVLSVFGSGLAPAIQLDGVLPLPLTMQGVSATVNGVAAPLYYVSPLQINLQIPYETGARTAVVAINNNGKVASFPFNTDPAAPGIFVQNGNLVPIATGKPGDVLVLFMTGEGDVNPALITGASPAAGTAVSQLPQPRLPVTVTVGGIPAPIQFVGIPPLLVGTTQINFVIPSKVPAGAQPVVVTSNGVASPPANITVTNP
jgi:uncharacterized protein (TIGR03437 family)